MRSLRRIAYWLAVLVVAATLAYLIISLAEGLDPAEIAGALMASRVRVEVLPHEGGVASAKRPG